MGVGHRASRGDSGTLGGRSLRRRRRQRTNPKVADGGHAAKAGEEAPGEGHEGGDDGACDGDAALRLVVAFALAGSEDAAIERGESVWVKQAAGAAAWAKGACGSYGTGQGMEQPVTESLLAVLVGGTTRGNGQDVATAHSRDGARVREREREAGEGESAHRCRWCAWRCWEAWTRPWQTPLPALRARTRQG